MKLIRSFVFPWFLYFASAMAAYIILGVRFPHLSAKSQEFYYFSLGLGGLLCLFTNYNSLGGVGIWMSEALPESLRYGFGTWRWFLRAIKAGAVGAAFWFAGQLPFIPLAWQGIVIPTVFTICLFVIVWSLLGPILMWASNLMWSRGISIILSLPVLVCIPATAYFLGQTVVVAYRASQADVTPFEQVAQDDDDNEPDEVRIRGRVLSAVGDEIRFYGEWPVGSGKLKTFDIKLEAISPSIRPTLPTTPTAKEITLDVAPKAVKEVAVKSKPNELNDKDIRTRLESTRSATRASALREIYEFSTDCDAYNKDIQAALDPKGNKEVVYWAARAVECAEIRPFIALPRLVDIMMGHSDPSTRAAAIRAMKKYGHTQVSNLSYLMVKRLSESEPPEVVEATAHLLAPLGGDHLRWASNKLKGLLDSPNVSMVAAQELVQDYGRVDLVAEHVEKNLVAEGDAKMRAIEMICLLPKQSRKVAEPHVAQIIGLIKVPDKKDPAIRALDCMGRAGFEALRKELADPKKLDRSVAAQSIAQLNIKEYPEAVDVSNECTRNGDEKVRTWCSRNLGRLGAQALPQILDLLKSNDSQLKEAGRNALRFMEDPEAKPELQKIVRANSGWMANNRKLQIAKAAGSALQKIEQTTVASASDVQKDASSPAPASTEKATDKNTDKPSVPSSTSPSPATKSVE